jgi:hypothetical protein
MSIARRGDRYGTYLVTDRREAQTLVARADHDALTALRRGMAEYLLHYMHADIAGREVTLESVLWGWADFELRGRFPAAYVTHAGEVRYDATTTSRGSSFKGADAGKTRLDVVADLTATIEVHLYAKDPVQRMALVRALERAVYPADWLDGLRLRLAYYHQAFARYDLQTVIYEDSTEDAQQLLRQATVTFTASVPLVVPRSAKAGTEGRATLTVTPTGSA